MSTEDSAAFEDFKFNEDETAVGPSNYPPLNSFRFNFTFKALITWCTKETSKYIIREIMKAYLKETVWVQAVIEDWVLNGFAAV